MSDQQKIYFLMCCITLVFYICCEMKKVENLCSRSACPKEIQCKLQMQIVCIIIIDFLFYKSKKQFKYYILLNIYKILLFLHEININLIMLLILQPYFAVQSLNSVYIYNYRTSVFGLAVFQMLSHICLVATIMDSVPLVGSP